MNTKKEIYLLAFLRISLGLIFLWAFLDKLFGFGFSTPRDKSWLLGGSPTYGFLSNAVHGPFSSFYNSIASSSLVEWLFMLGLFFIGLCLILGIASRISGYLGSLLMILMWSSLLPPANHPFIDEHIIYALVLITIAVSDAGNYLGIGKWWSSISLVRNLPFLK